MLKVVGFMVLLSSSGAVFAAPDRVHSEISIRDVSFHRIEFKEPRWCSAPEIDPASAGAALTMLGGLLAVMRGRRSKDPG